MWRPNSRVRIGFLGGVFVNDVVFVNEFGILVLVLVLLVFVGLFLLLRRRLREFLAEAPCPTRHLGRRSVHGGRGRGC